MITVKNEKDINQLEDQLNQQYVLMKARLDQLRQKLAGQTNDQNHQMYHQIKETFDINKTTNQISHGNENNFNSSSNL